MVKKQKKQDDGSTEARILEAAQKVFLKKGMDGARMQDIADEAGINKALLHYYFRSKEKLFETIFMQVIADFLPRITNILESDMPFFSKIEMLCNEYITQIMETPYVPVFIINEVHRQPKAFIQKVLKGRRAPIQPFVKQLQSEIRHGRIKPVQPVQLLMNILSLCLFPFLARPVLLYGVGLEQEQFDTMMEQRKTQVPRLIIESIKK